MCCGQGTQKCERRMGGVWYTQRGMGERRREEKGKKGKEGKEKTRLPQHDLQIALSPWRLLSAPLFDFQSGGPKLQRPSLGGATTEGRR